MPTNNNYTYAPAAVDTGAAAPAPIGPLDTAPAAVPPGPGLGYVPTTTRAPIIPQVELPVQTQLTPEGETGPNVGGTTQQRYLTILANGVVVTNNAATLDFEGNGFTIANLGTNGATITLNAAAGGYGNSNVVTLLAAFGSNTVSTTGNVTAGYVFGNGSQLTGLPATYGNANVITLLSSLGSNIISGTGNITTTANISGGYILGNGSQLSGLPATYGNANVVANLAALGSNPVSTTGNVTAGNIVTGGLISATGNVSGNFFIGNGSLLTGIAASYGNANVVANLAALGSNPVSTTGNVTGGNVLTAGIVSATGNITGNYFVGNGSLLTGVTVAAGTSIVNGTSNVVVGASGNVTVGVAGTSNVVVWATTGEYITGVVSASGNITGGNVLTGGVISATANITGGNLLTGGLISATSTIISVANITGGNVLTGGLISATANITGGNLLTGGLISATSTITSAANVTGGNLLTGGLISATANITGGNLLTGGLISATSTITSAANVTGGNLLTGGVISATANITGGNVLTGGLISATANITGGNVLTGGLISATGNISANNLALAGNITSSIGFTGATITINNAPGGNEGAEVIWALPSAANTVLNTSLIQDVFQNGMRFFESGGSSRGLYMDLGNVPNGSGTAVGYRDIPQVSFAANATIAATDAGRHYYSTSASNLTLTIANNTSVSWAVGTAITVVNRGSGNITVAQGSGVSLYLAGNSSAANRTVSTYGMATLLNVAANVWMINGTGLT